MCALSMYICKSHAGKLSTVESKAKQDHQEVHITESSNYGEKCILQFILWTLT